MRPFYYKLIVISALLLCQAVALSASGLSARRDLSMRMADSLMRQVIFFAPTHSRMIDDYRAKLYIKGKVNIKKQNRLLRFLPSMFRIRKGVKEYMMETYSDLHFTAPDIYDQKITATIGTASEFWEVDGRLPEYFYINIYDPSLLDDKLVSPLAPNARKYYTYRVDSVMGTRAHRSYRISFKPRNKSYQLVKGYMVVSAEVWSIREMQFTGRSELFRFSTLVRMGDVGADDEFLPRTFDIDATFRFLGNEVIGSYVAMLDYKSISQHNEALQAVRLQRRKSRYDLTDSYTLRTDTNASQRDTSYFNSVRPLSLSPHEQELYTRFFARNDSINRTPRHRSKALEFWGELGDALISRYTIDLNRLGSVRCSPLINPFLLSYSGRDGVSYRQEFKYNRIFSGDRLLRIVPRIGYNFKYKEFYWRIRSQFDYWPRKRSSLHVEFGNGNRIYSSEMLEELKAMPDSIFDFNQIHLDYFTDLYLNVSNSWEIVNGLTLDVGLSLHRRSEVEKSRFVFNYPITGGGSILPGYPSGFDPSILQKFRSTYNSFAPRVRLSYTPGQYYYHNGDRKINLYSRYPTFSVDYERGIKGVLPSSSSYERVEADVQQHIKLSPMRNLYWRAGFGAFTNQEKLYFVDFANLRRSNLPTGWNDDIGGVFQLLDGRWYNSSRRYLRGHVVYEAPFLLMRHLSKYTRFVLNERLYFNALRVPHLKPYLEAGYGIGTHVFDFGFFSGFSNWKFDGVGVKFTFELFNR